jgi:catechol 2,3-dioxygenase-like lactoylglutathione lyase family enzyme
VCKDIRSVQHFYEDVIGFPLVATWAEQTEVFGKTRTFVHAFFDVGDNTSLAFFQFADVADLHEFGPDLPPSGFRHIAFSVSQSAQDDLVKKLEVAGYFEQQQAYKLDHGYCYSLYCFDPSGLLIEFVVDNDDIDAINQAKRLTAHRDLAQWLAGDHTPNNQQFHRH